jgi:hypothetical protein
MPWSEFTSPAESKTLGSFPGRGHARAGCFVAWRPSGFARKPSQRADPDLPAPEEHASAGLMQLAKWSATSGRASGERVSNNPPMLPCSGRGSR